LSRFWDKIPDWKSLICPECLEPTIWLDPEIGEKVCTRCGYVVSRENSTVHRLPFDETYALQNRLVFNNSLGGTAGRKTVLKVLSKTRNSKWKVRMIADAIRLYSKGEASLIDVARKTLEVFVDLGVQEMMKTLKQAMEKTDDPDEIARRIVNRFDAIPIRQIMTLHELHETPLLRRVKEELENLRKQYGPSRIRPYADPDVFSDELGRLAGKVCQAASLNPRSRFKAKDLAAAIFIKTVNLVNPRITVRYPKAPEEVLKFVEQVQVEELKMRNGNGG